MPAAQAAPVIVFNSISASCPIQYTSGYLQSNRLKATRDLNVSAINFPTGTQSLSGSYALYIYSDSATAKTPYTRLATFNFTSNSGASPNVIARFTGSYAIPSGTFFWIVPQYNAATMNWCYSNTLAITDFTFNGVIPDTSTSNLSNVFRKVYLGASTPPNPGAWDFTGDASQFWTLSIESTPPVPASATLSLATGTAVAASRTQVSLQATVNSSAKVTFYSFNKVIANCRNIATSGGIATCGWKPSVIGANSITAKIVSTDSNYTDGWATPFTALITKRLNNR